MFYIDWDGTHSPQDQQPPAAPSLDVNGDGVISPGDVLRLIHYINSFDPPPYDPAYDLNQDGRVTQQDVLLILYYLRSLAPDGAP